MMLDPARLVLGSLILSVVSLIAWGIVWTVKHPCIESHEKRTWVEETTTYITVGAVDVGDIHMPGTQVPTTTPAHWETETVCDERKP